MEISLNLLKPVYDDDPHNSRMPAHHHHLPPIIIINFYHHRHMRVCQTSFPRGTPTRGVTRATLAANRTRKRPRLPYSLMYQYNTYWTVTCNMYREARG